MKTGPHSFKDATGVEWFITGYSKSCGAAYVDCRSEDGVALTVRPVAYLAPAGLSIPEGAEPPPKRKPTAKEKRKAESEAERLLTTESKPQLQLVPDEPAESSEPGPQIVPFEKADPLSDPASGQGPNADAGLSHMPHEPRCGCIRCAREKAGTVDPDPTTPPSPEHSFAAGRFVLLNYLDGAAEAHYVTSFDTWEEAQVVFPLDVDSTLVDCVTSQRWDVLGQEHDSTVRPGDYRATTDEVYDDAHAADVRESECAVVVNKKHEAFDIDIGRPGPWGNPYSHMQGTSALHVVATRDEAISYYETWLKDRIRAQEPGLVQALAALHGKRLGCYCAPESCHGDVLARAAEWAAGCLLTEPSQVG